MSGSVTNEALGHLPLRPAAFAVLAVLASGARSGVTVMEHVNATVRGRPFLGPGTFYRLLRELRQSGLITEADRPGSTDRQDDRQSHHELTRLGRAVLTAETARLTRTLALVPDAIRSAGGRCGSSSGSMLDFRPAAANESEPGSGAGPEPADRVLTRGTGEGGMGSHVRDVADGARPGKRMTSREVRELVERAIDGHWNRSNRHGVDLRTGLREPYLTECLDSANGDLVALWIVLSEVQGGDDGYGIAFDDRSNEFGLVTFAPDEAPVLVGIYGSFLQALEAM